MDSEGARGRGDHKEITVAMGRFARTTIASGEPHA
jgi:hypothetical protein